MKPSAMAKLTRASVRAAVRNPAVRVAYGGVMLTRAWRQAKPRSSFLSSADSDELDEYDESLLKASKLLQALGATVLSLSLEAPQDMVVMAGTAAAVPAH
jgi:hypothetical protein